jgi:hypothetical protein
MVDKGMISSQDLMAVTYYVKKMEAKLRTMKELLQ